MALAIAVSAVPAAEAIRPIYVDVSVRDGQLAVATAGKECPIEALVDWFRAFAASGHDADPVDLRWTAATPHSAVREVALAIQRAGMLDVLSSKPDGRKLPARRPILPSDALSPGVAFAEVRAFHYAGTTESAIDLKSGKLHPDVINPNGAVLAASQVVRLSQAINQPMGTSDRSWCFWPHHAFVFYDAAKKPVAAIDICLSCQEAKVAPDRSTPADIDFGALATILEELGIPLHQDTPDAAAYIAEIRRKKQRIAANRASKDAQAPVSLESNSDQSEGRPICVDISVEEKRVVFLAAGQEHTEESLRVWLHSQAKSGRADDPVELRWTPETNYIVAISVASRLVRTGMTKVEFNNARPKLVNDEDRGVPDHPLWPTQRFTEVRAFSNRPKNSAPIIDLKTGVLHESVYSKEGVALTATQTVRLIQGMHQKFDPAQPPASCFIPHHAFVFYDGKTPVAYVEVCLMCKTCAFSSADYEGSVDYVAMATLLAEVGLFPADRAVQYGEEVEKLRQELSRGPQR